MCVSTAHAPGGQLMACRGEKEHDGLCFFQNWRWSRGGAPVQVGDLRLDPFAGVGPDTPIKVNEHGAGQSDVPYRFDLFDPAAMLKMAGVLDSGARKYGEGNWRGLPIEDHLNHLIMHAYAWLAGDRQDDHLSHVMCRAMFAQGVEIQGGPLTEGFHRTEPQT